MIVDDVPDTRDSLLIWIADPRDQSAWEQFARIYRPVVYNVARMRGLQDADAQDVVQQVLIALARALPTWERRDESTPLFKAGQLAGITLLGTRFMKGDLPGSYVVPVRRIVQVLQQLKIK